MASLRRVQDHPGGRYWQLSGHQTCEISETSEVFAKILLLLVADLDKLLSLGAMVMMIRTHCLRPMRCEGYAKK